MPTYRANATVTGSKYLGEFEAASEDEARTMAEESEAAWVGLCHQCSSQCEDPEITEVHVDLVEAEEAPAPKKRKKKQ